MLPPETLDEVDKNNVNPINKVTNNTPTTPTNVDHEVSEDYDHLHTPRGVSKNIVLRILYHIKFMKECRLISFI